MSARPHVHVVYCGGTVGMRQTESGYRPAPGFLAERMAAMPEFSHPAIPRYTIQELDPLLDSANASPGDWIRIGREIAARHDDHDGFVVLHGTDTMAYAASALSFMLEGLAKPVIFTGSQIPLAEIRNDARHNLLTALMLAGDSRLAEVCLFFGERLLRGNRATKVSATDFRAFDSPNHPGLGSAGVTIEVRHDRLLPPPDGPLRFRPVLRPHVADLRLFPGLLPDTLERFLQPPLEGAVLHTYGVGNAPEDPDFLAALAAATARGVVIVNCTQCLQGSVDMEGYATGRGLRRAGLISGFDMTSEAALTKLYYLLSCDLPTAEVRRQMQLSLRGELTLPAAVGR